MTEAEIEVILERAREKYPEAKPRIISDNMLAGRQAEIHAARDCKLEQARRERQLRRRSSSPMFSPWPFAATMTPSSEMNGDQ
jgi:hypothetical protein